MITLATMWLLSDPQMATPPCNALGKSLVEHACVHAKHGPFAEGPSVNQVHTYFRIALPADATQAMVTYVPARSGEWALFTTPAVPLTVLDTAGQPLTPGFEQDVAGCPELPRASVFQLDAGATYKLLLGPSSAAREVGLVLEKLSDFVLFYYADQDGDAHGDPAGEIETACMPPAGHVEANDDCDDRLAAVHPGAAELCNGRDDNCNGTRDEQCPDGPGEATPAGGSCQLARGAPFGAVPALVFLAALLQALRRLARRESGGDRS